MELLDTARVALLEDRANNDVTAASLVTFLGSRSDVLPEQAGFYIQAKESGVFSGRAWVEAVLRAFAELQTPEGSDAAWGGAAVFHVESLLEEGARFEVGDRVLTARGPVAAVLSVERVLLNGLQYACGVATVTRRYVDEVARRWEGRAGEAPGVYHTRKTPPGIRDLAVQGVLAGGGRAHRRDLGERVLFKENHKYWLKRFGWTLGDYAAYLETWGFDAPLVEVESEAEARECWSAGVKHLLLDNFSPAQAEACLKHAPIGAVTEVSGGLSFEKLGEYLVPGVQRLSVGALTRNVATIDLSLDWGDA